MKSFIESVDFFKGNDPEEIAGKYGTPLYVYSEDIIRDRMLRVAGVIKKYPYRANYSCKTNTNLEILRIANSVGVNADAMSEGEMRMLLAAGFSPDRIFYVPNNVSSEEMRFSIDNNIMISLDSLDQLDRFGSMCPGGRCAVRINPGVGAGHHEKVVTAGKKTKFGIDEEDIDYSEGSFYKLGESEDNLYNQFYLLIITKKIKNYLNLKSKNIPHACEKAGVDITEISNWYDRKVKNIIRSNYKKELDISFNQMSRILMGKWIECRENKEKKEDIQTKLMLSDRVLEFWQDDNLRNNSKYPYINEFIFKNREIEMKLFVEGLGLSLNKQDAIEYADTDLDFVNKYFNLNNEDNLIKRWRIGKQTSNEESFKTYKNVYFHNKTKEFLDCLKDETIDSALLKSDFDEEDFNNWYNAGKREFFRSSCKE